MKTVDVLQKAKELLTPETWTKGAYGKDKDGNPIYATSPTAVKLCVMGAIKKAQGSDSEGYPPFNALYKALGEVMNIASYNDDAERTLGDIHNLLDDAVKYAKEHPDDIDEFYFIRVNPS